MCQISTKITMIRLLLLSTKFDISKDLQKQLASKYKEIVSWNQNGKQRNEQLTYFYEHIKKIEVISSSNKWDRTIAAY